MTSDTSRTMHRGDTLGRWTFHASIDVRDLNRWTLNDLALAFDTASFTAAQNGTYGKTVLLEQTCAQLIVAIDDRDRRCKTRATLGDHGLNHEMIGAAALVSLRREARDSHIPAVEYTVCHIHGLRVAEPFRGMGVGCDLYEAIRCYALEESQQILRNTPCLPIEPGTTVAGVYYPPHLTLSFELAPGSCRRKASMVEFLGKMGWVANLATASVHGPAPESIRTPYLATTRKRRPAVAPGDVFVPPGEWSVLDAVMYKDALVVNSRLQAEQQALFRSPGLFCRYAVGPTSRHTGLNSFHIDLTRPCRILEDLLRDGTCFGPQGFKFPGCDVQLVPLAPYQIINATTLVPAEQAKRTLTTRNPDDARSVADAVPYVAEILRQSLLKLGMDECEAEAGISKVGVLHYFCTESTLQASYDWHTDDSALAELLGLQGSREEQDKAAFGVRSVVVQLSGEWETAMCMHGFHPTVYSGRGSGVAFHGSAVHRSVPWSPAVCGLLRAPTVWKMAAFWLPKDLGLMEREL